MFPFLRRELFCTARETVVKAILLSFPPHILHDVLGCLLVGPLTFICWVADGLFLTQNIKHRAGKKKSRICTPRKPDVRACFSVVPDGRRRPQTLRYHLQTPPELALFFAFLLFWGPFVFHSPGKYIYIYIFIYTYIHIYIYIYIYIYTHFLVGSEFQRSKGTGSTCQDLRRRRGDANAVSFSEALDACAPRRKIPRSFRTKTVCNYLVAQR